MRYERATLRERFGDGKTLAEFKAGEEQEINAGEKGQQLVPCMRLADYFIVNDGTLEHLTERIEEILNAVTSRTEEKK